MGDSQFYKTIEWKFKSSDINLILKYHKFGHSLRAYLVPHGANGLRIQDVMPKGIYFPRLLVIYKCEY